MQSTLGPEFLPPALFNRAYAARAVSGQPLVLALERESGLVSRFETCILEEDPDTLRYVERIVKFLLWSRGGWKLTVHGPASIADFLRREYSPAGARAFDVELMERIYGKSFEVVRCEMDAAPVARESGSALGGHLDGCRIGFDLGASDYKISAAQDGKVVFSEECPWNAREQSDPAYHWNHLNEGLRAATACLPKVDAIGSSSAGVIVDNEIRVASLFRSVAASVEGPVTASVPCNFIHGRRCSLMPRRRHRSPAPDITNRAIKTNRYGKPTFNFDPRGNWPHRRQVSPARQTAGCIALRQWPHQSHARGQL